MNPHHPSADHPADPHSLSPSPVFPFSPSSSSTPRADAWGSPDPQVEHCEANKFAPKLDAAAKDEICRLLSSGHTISAAARQVGVSDRAIRYAAERDAVFKLRIGKDREKVSGICLETLTIAAGDPEKWRATTPLMKLAYPERMNQKAGRMPIAEARMLLGVARDAFDAFLTDPTQRGQFGDQLARAVADALQQTKSSHSAEDLLGG